MPWASSAVLPLGYNLRPARITASDPVSACEIAHPQRLPVGAKRLINNDCIAEEGNLYPPPLSRSKAYWVVRCAVCAGGVARMYQIGD